MLTLTMQALKSKAIAVPNHILLPVTITASIYAIFILMRLDAHQYDVSYFVHAGDLFTNPAAVPSGLTVFDSSTGYDGQFYYRLALDPFTSEQNAYGIRFDNPPYRHQRILYPFVVWALSFGQPVFLPWLLLAINYIAVGILALLASWLARSFGQHSLWSIVIPLYPGFFISLSYDLAEIIELCFLLSAIIAIRNGRSWFGAIFLTLALFTKETVLLVPAAFAVFALLHSWQARAVRFPHWPVFVLPAIVYAAWQAMLWWRWGQLPFLAGGHNIGLPLQGIITHVDFVLSTGGPIPALWWLEMSFFPCLVFLAVRNIKLAAWSSPERLILVMYVLFCLSLGSAVLIEDLGFLRGLSELYVLASLIIISRPTPLARRLYACSLPVWFLILLRTTP